MNFDSTTTTTNDLPCMFVHSLEPITDIPKTQSTQHRKAKKIVCKYYNNQIRVIIHKAEGE